MPGDEDVPVQDPVVQPLGAKTRVVLTYPLRWVFVFGFAKNERGNINRGEEAALKELALHLLSLTPQAVVKARVPANW